MMPGDNPYTPPLTASSGVPDAPRPYGWEVEKATVWVKQSSQLPMVDPYTGRSGETMMLQRVQVRYRPVWLSWLILPGALVGVILFGLRDPSFNLFVPGLAGMFFGWLFSYLIGLAYPFCTLRLFFEKQTLRRRSIGTAVMNILFLVGVFGESFTRSAPEWLSVIPTIAILSWIVGLVVSLGLKRRLRCDHKAGERFGIRGFHPRALTALAAEK